MKRLSTNCLVMVCIFVATIFPMLVFSNPVSETDMIRYGKRAFFQRAAAMAPEAVDYQMKDFTPVTVDGTMVMGILNFDNGFLIMAADDASQPVLAYSFEGNFRMEDAAPGALTFIHQYEREILFIKRENIAATEQVREMWKDLDSRDVSQITTTVVSPLIKSMWNQTKFYNRYSPLDQNAGASFDFRTPNGCVAVAMAMIMYYYRYPLHGTGSHTNHTSYGNYYVNFAQQTYNYETMCDELSGYNDEVAKLIFHCATAVDMMYGVDGSGAYSESVPDAVKDYFGYSSQCNLRSKNNYSSSSWINVLQSELDAARPLYYSGSSDEGGHAFVCDGYDSENMFHFNFGWGGNSNGSYAVSNANNAVNGFNNWQRATTNFYPADANYPYQCNSKVINSYSGTLEDGSSIENYANNRHCEWVITEDSAYAVFVNFDYFNTQAGHDSLCFWDGHPAQGNLLLSLSGDGLAQSSYTFSTDSLYVTFDSDDYGTADGWRFSYQVDRRMYACQSGNYNACSGVLTDGSGDATYKPNAFCFWKLRISNASWIKIYFDEFDISPEDELRIYDQSTAGSQLLYSLTGSTLPDTITIPANHVQLTFLSDNAIQRNGFRMYWTTDCATDVAVEEYLAQDDIRCYPNPASDQLTVEVPSLSTDAEVEVFDMTGRMVLSHRLASSNVASLPVADLRDGFYLVKVIVDNRIYNTKVVIRH